MQELLVKLYHRGKMNMSAWLCTLETICSQHNCMFGVPFALTFSCSISGCMLFSIEHSGSSKLSCNCISTVYHWKLELLCNYFISFKRTTFVDSTKQLSEDVNTLEILSAVEHCRRTITYVYSIPVHHGVSCVASWFSFSFGGMRDCVVDLSGDF